MTASGTPESSENSTENDTSETIEPKKERLCIADSSRSRRSSGGYRDRNLLCQEKEEVNLKKSQTILRVCDFFARSVRRKK